ncbi:MAG: ATP-binding cassette domain-containing protein [Bacteroidales bacterium]|jgi:phospholipid/cholesterol/gamma-HCH transport system ATP-binding protein|nr:ATP-binding cassette domain-containing protein [Bacteroidales bacterium]NCU34792.1 ATP-binding cassette domain-containing protein [Candidatus Falkowbacteria bacterium]MDD2631314.1 ATP-binding cassette domain-containing protein [Bacteroidales bacterium]MDD3131036.1 ATP-binding cassette domain-containing protein [Bacteroidales bacterium]MDD3527382.1 ATP-binding cassette domain-containing protein [Bacteroidales bacterium]
MIEARNINKSFGDNHVLKDVSVKFKKGITNLVIGQSGSGKTVLLKCFVGLLEVDSGEIRYDDRVFSTMSWNERKEIRKEIGMLFQGGALFDYMNVEENVMFPLTMFSKMTPKEQLDRVNFCLERVNLPGVNKLMPSELSGGMVKRVAIARAIVMEPRYLFCDEPNSGLDPQTSNVIDNLINEITQELDITTVINTHDMNSVMEIGDQISFIYNGELWWEGNKDTILTTGNKEINDFVFASKLARQIK